MISIILYIQKRHKNHKEVILHKKHIKKKKDLKHNHKYNNNNNINIKIIEIDKIRDNILIKHYL